MNNLTYFIESFVKVDSLITINGWCFDKHKKIKEVTLSINDSHTTVKPYISRKDIKVKYNLKSEENLGFFIKNTINNKNFFLKVILTFSFENDEKVSFTLSRGLNKENEYFIKITNKLSLFFNAFYICSGLISKSHQHLRFNNYKLKYSFFEYFKRIRNHYYYLKYQLNNKNHLIDNNFDEKLIKHFERSFYYPDKIKSNILSEIKNFKYQPLISIIVPVYNTPKRYFEELISSLENQFYQKYELIIIDNSPNNNLKELFNKSLKTKTKIKYKKLTDNFGISHANNIGIQLSKGKYIGFLDHDDLLTQDCLYLFVKELNNNRLLKWLYSDEAKFNNKGIYDFQYKTSFNFAQLLSTNIIGHFMLIHKDILKKVKFETKHDGAQDFDMCLKLAQLLNENEIKHIPAILYLWRAHKNSIAESTSNKHYILDRAKNVLHDFFIRESIDADIMVNEECAQIGNIVFNIIWKEKSTLNDSVTILIPNKDSKELLKKCINSLIETIDLDIHKILIIDDNSSDLNIFEYYKEIEKLDININVIFSRSSDNQFNYSRLINEALAFIDTPNTLQLNNDIFAVEKGWLDQLINWNKFNNNKIAGIKLLYPNNNVQHLGVRIGAHGGLADHFFLNDENNIPKYFSYNMVSRNTSAVTGACLLSPTSLLKKNKFNEDDFAVQYNDVDYCLRARNDGYNVVTESKFYLYHHESASRKRNYNKQEHLNFLKKYSNYDEPFYNLNFNINSNNFSISSVPYIWNDEIFNLNILIAVHELTLTGGPIVALNLANYLIKKNCSVTIISPKIGPLQNRISSNIDLIILDQETSPYFMDEKEFKIFKNKINKIDIKNFDILITNTIESLWMDLHSELRKLKIKNILNIHEGITMNEYKSRFQNEKVYLAYEKNIKNKDLIVSQCKHTLNNFGSLKTKNFALIPGGISDKMVDSFKNNNSKQSLRKKYKIDQKLIVISNIGTVCERKDQLTFIKSAIKFLKSNSSYIAKYKFLIVGDIHSDYSKTCHDEVISSSYVNNFHFVKETNDINDFYVLSDYFVCSSIQESFPMVILLAMAFEIPIITTPVNGIKEMVTDEEATFFELGNIQDLFKTFKYIENNSSQFFYSKVISARSKFLREYKEDVSYNTYFQHILNLYLN